MIEILTEREKSIKQYEAIDEYRFAETYYGKPLRSLQTGNNLKKLRRATVKFAKKKNIVTPSTSTPPPETRRGIAALATQIPNQYVQLGQLFNYAVPAGTFTGTGLVYKAYCNQLAVPKDLPMWLTFNPATQTFNGIPSFWFEVEVLQVVVEAYEAATPLQKVHSIFILRVGASQNLGKRVWRAGQVVQYTLTDVNIGGFNTGAVVATDTVLIDSSLTRNTLTQTSKDKINEVRLSNCLIAWKLDNSNGLYSGKLSRIDYEFIEGNENIVIDFSGGNTKAIAPQGKLWRGLRGKEIIITNYFEPGYILSRDGSNGTNINAIQNRRSEDNFQHKDENWIVFGQPKDNVPFKNLYGVGIKEGIAWSYDGPNGYVEGAYIDCRAGTIGCHWKPNTTKDKGDRRSSENKFGWNMNQSYQQIHDSFFTGMGGEGIYLGGGGWSGQTVKILHTNPDGTPKMVLINGVNVQEYHNIRRFNSVHDHIKINDNIFISTGWDAAQTRCVIGWSMMCGNYAFKTAQHPTVAPGQSEAFITDGGVGEVSYNFGEKSYQTGLRMGMLGMDCVHHNIIVKIGHPADFTSPNLPNNTGLNDAGGGGIYCGNRGTVIDDVPQLHIAEYPDWVPETTYLIDASQNGGTAKGVKIKYLGKSYRSKADGNTGNQPDTSPLWWEDTREWVSSRQREDLVLANLYFKCFHNTFVDCFYTIETYLPLPYNQKWFYNNFWFNSGDTRPTTDPAKFYGQYGGNLAVLGASPVTYFTDYVNYDFRPPVGSPLIGAGVDISALTGTTNEAFHFGFKDFGGNVHANPPAIGAYEGAANKGDHYLWGAKDIAAPLPPPIEIDAGLPQRFNLPQSSITITAVKSDPARVLNSIVWSQTSGPAANIANGNTLTATFSNLQVGTATFKIVVVDEYGQASQDSVTITVDPEGIVEFVTYQWFTVTDPITKANKTAILNSNLLNISKVPYIGSGLYLLREIRPVSTNGVLIGNVIESNVIGPF